MVPVASPMITKPEPACSIASGSTVRTAPVTCTSVKAIVPPSVTTPSAGSVP